MGGIYPIIHIDAHGNDKGLKLRSGDVLKWHETKNILTRINISCHNNLILTLASCKGAYLFEIVKPTERAPFFMLIASGKDITTKIAETSFISFYKELLSSDDASLALKKLSNDFSAISCIHLFITVFIKYYKEFCKGKKARQRIEDLITAVRKERPEIGLRELRRRIKNDIKNNPNMHFEICKNTFFMVDLYKENAKRFNITVDDVLSLDNYLT